MKTSRTTERASAKKGGPRPRRAAAAAPELSGVGVVTAEGAPGHRSVTFRFHAAPDAEVLLAGTFNGWEPSAYPLEPGTPERELHQATLVLPPGRHEYKFVVNGAWQADPDCPECAVNAFGSLNSVIHV
jgi:1,4-alpha-glucan branching enzyme